MLSLSFWRRLSHLLEFPWASASFFLYLGYIYPAETAWLVKHQTVSKYQSFDWSVNQPFSCSKRVRVILSNTPRRQYTGHACPHRWVVKHASCYIPHHIQQYRDKLHTTQYGRTDREMWASGVRHFLCVLSFHRRRWPKRLPMSSTSPHTSECHVPQPHCVSTPNSVHIYHTVDKILHC